MPYFFRYAREQAGLTVEEVAALTGYVPITVRQMETNGCLVRRGDRYVRRMTQALGLDEDWVTEAMALDRVEDRYDRLYHPERSPLPKGSPFKDGQPMLRQLEPLPPRRKKGDTKPFLTGLGLRAFFVPIHRFANPAAQAASNGREEI